MLAQKAFQGSKMEGRELLGGTEEKSIIADYVGVIDLPSRQINDFCYKKETEMN